MSAPTRASIQARAQAIAVEQSVEMPLSAIEDQAILDEIVGRVEGDQRMARRTLRGAHRVRGRDRRQRSRPAPQHAVRQHLAAGRRDAARRRIAERDGRRYFGGPHLRAARPAQARRSRQPRLHLLGAETARPLAGTTRARSRRGSRAAGSTTSRTITAWPIRPIAVRCAHRGGREGAREVERETGHRARYVPSLTGDLDALRAQIAAAREPASTP